ncbi:MAG: carboxypeptidase-like regulatory domain-containing protein, partial [Candidatus Limnocylindria bacterium]
AHPAGDDPPVCGRADANGAFALVLRPAVYRLELHGPDDGSRLLSQWAVGRVGSYEADTFDVRRHDVDGIDIVLVGGVVLSGTVRAARDGAVAPEAQVCTMTLAAPLPWDCARTDRAGAYRLLREPGRYWVWIVPADVRGSRLIPQRYERAAVGVDARPFVLAADATLDVALGEGPLIEGRVTVGGDGTPVAFALVCVDTPFTSGRICRETGDDGRYSVATRPETYVISVIPPAGSGVVAEYWSRKRDWTEADRLRVGGDVTLDVALERGLRVSGVVRTPEGIPVELATVNLNDARGVRAATSTDHRGRYEVALPPGAYTIDVFAPRASALVSVVAQPLTVQTDAAHDVVLPFSAP